MFTYSDKVKSLRANKNHTTEYCSVSAITRRSKTITQIMVVDRHNQLLQTNCTTNHPSIKPFVHSPSSTFAVSCDYFSPILSINYRHARCNRNMECISAVARSVIDIRFLRKHMHNNSIIKNTLVFDAIIEQYFKWVIYNTLNINNNYFIYFIAK